MLVEDIVDGAIDSVLGEEIPGGAVTGPDFGVLTGEVSLAESAGTPRFALVHDPLGRNRGGCNEVDVVGSDMEREQLPLAEGQVVADGLFDNRTLGLVKEDRVGGHFCALESNPVGLVGDVGSAVLVVSGVVC